MFVFHPLCIRKIIRPLIIGINILYLGGGIIKSTARKFINEIEAQEYILNICNPNRLPDNKQVGKKLVYLLETWNSQNADDTKKLAKVIVKEYDELAKYFNAGGTIVGLMLNPIHNLYLAGCLYALHPCSKRNNIKLKRKATVRTFHEIYIDIDCHGQRVLTINDAKRILYFLESDLFGNGVPVPSKIIFTGRGLHLHWFVSPQKACRMGHLEQIQSAYCNLVSTYIQECYKSILGDCFNGVDVDKLTDIGRLLRVPGTFNQKANVMSKTIGGNSQFYDIEELTSGYFDEISKDNDQLQAEETERYQNYLQMKEERAKKQAEEQCRIRNTETTSVKKSIPTSPAVVLYNRGRVEDLTRLIISRGKGIEGYRHKILMIAGTCIAFDTKGNEDYTSKWLYYLYGLFSLDCQYPYEENDLNNVIATVLNYYNTKHGAEKGTHKPKSDEAIIKELDITTDELETFKFITPKYFKKLNEDARNKARNYNKYGVTNAKLAEYYDWIKVTTLRDLEATKAAIQKETGFSTQKISRLLKLELQLPSDNTEMVGLAKKMAKLYTLGYSRAVIARELNIGIDLVIQLSTMAHQYIKASDTAESTDTTSNSSYKVGIQIPTVTKEDNILDSFIDPLGGISSKTVSTLSIIYPNIVINTKDSVSKE